MPVIVHHAGQLIPEAATLPLILVEPLSVVVLRVPTFPVTLAEPDNEKAPKEKNE